VAAGVVGVLGEDAADAVAGFGQALVGLVGVGDVADGRAAAAYDFLPAVADWVQRVGGFGDAAVGRGDGGAGEAVVLVVVVARALGAAGVDAALFASVAAIVVVVLEARDFAAVGKALVATDRMVNGRDAVAGVLGEAGDLAAAVLARERAADGALQSASRRLRGTEAGCQRARGGISPRSRSLATDVALQA